MVQWLVESISTIALKIKSIHLTKMFRILVTVLFVTFLSNNCLGQQIKFTDCTETDPKDYCKINDVTITPCKETATRACILKKGKSYSIQMDISALKKMDTIKSLPYWAAPDNDLPFVGMNEDACSFMQCPVAEGTNQTYNFDLKIAKYLPRGQFDVKWKFSADNVNDNGCCARFFLKLI